MYDLGEILILGCFVFGHGIIYSDQLPSPMNVSFTWTDEKFHYFGNLTWIAPEKGSLCKYKVVVQEKDQNILELTGNTYFNRAVRTETGVNFSVQALCNGSESKPVELYIPSPIELVKDFQCSLYSSKGMNCSWLSVIQPSDLQVYYRWVGRPQVGECDLYNGSMRTECHLIDESGILSRTVFFLVNGTLNGSSVQNTFLQIPHNQVRPPAPRLNVTEDGDHLILSWISPDIGNADCWNYIINTGCTEPWIIKPIDKKVHSLKRPYYPHCQHRIRLKAVFESKCGKGESPWSEEEIRGSNGNPHRTVLVAAGIIPVMLAFCAIMMFVCFMKYKDRILPKIPEPTNLLRDMFNNNSNEMSSIGDLYVPVREEEGDCQITLVQEDPLHMQDPILP